MEQINELRYYLEIMRGAMTPQVIDELVEDCENLEPLKPTYFITAVKLPTGAIELAINTENILEKIDYVLNAYDEEMRLKTNPEIVMCQLMVV